MLGACEGEEGAVGLCVSARIIVGDFDLLEEVGFVADDDDHSMGS